MNSSSAKASNRQTRASVLNASTSRPRRVHHETSAAQILAHALVLRAGADVAILATVRAIADAAHRLGVAHRVEVGAPCDPALRSFAVTEMRLARQQQRHLKVGRL